MVILLVDMQTLPAWTIPILEESTTQITKSCHSNAYDGLLRVVDEAKEIWRDVDLARGKGKEKEAKDKSPPGFARCLLLSSSCASASP
jgi:hypothetical protein